LADHHHREPISANTLRGATFLGGGSGDIGGVFAGNVVKYNGQHGIYVAGEHWLVEGNRVEANSRTTNDTLRALLFGSPIRWVFLAGVVRALFLGSFNSSHSRHSGIRVGFGGCVGRHGLLIGARLIPGGELASHGKKAPRRVAETPAAGVCLKWALSEPGSHE
jgi:hypothetical protein